MNSVITRQLSIDLITDTPNEIIVWFNDLWSKLYIIETDVYHNDGGEIIYYIIMGGKKQWIFFQDNENGRFWCDYDNYWSILQYRFYCEYNDIQAITKILVENALNNSVATPLEQIQRIYKMVENALNNSVATPLEHQYQKLSMVENALNNSVATPESTIFF